MPTTQVPSDSLAEVPTLVPTEGSRCYPSEAEVATDGSGGIRELVARRRVTPGSIRVRRGTSWRNILLYSASGSKVDRVRHPYPQPDLEPTKHISPCPAFQRGWTASPGRDRSTLAVRAMCEAR
jgi:hypothetical protein